MCRFAIYLGKPIRARQLLLEGEHSLYLQSYRPAELLSGSVNADGFGLGWYNHAIDHRPACYRRAEPIWADRDLPGLSRLVMGEVLVANVRNATDSATAGSAATQPFDSGPYLFMHNGYIEDFRTKMRRQLQARLSAAAYAALQSATDSETIFGLITDQLNAGQDMVSAVRSVIGELAGSAQAGGLTLQLNFALTDGHSAVVTRWANDSPANSLYLLERKGFFAGGVVVASEPLTPDDPWEAVPEGSLISLHPDRPAVVEALGVPVSGPISAGR